MTIVLSYYGYIWTAEITPAQGNKNDVVFNNTFDLIERTFSYNRQAVDEDMGALDRVYPILRQILGI